MSYLYFNDPSDNYEFVISKIKTSLNKNLIIETDNNNKVLLDSNLEVNGTLNLNDNIKTLNNIAKIPVTYNTFSITNTNELNDILTISANIWIPAMNYEISLNKLSSNSAIKLEYKINYIASNESGQQISFKVIRNNDDNDIVFQDSLLGSNMGVTFHSIYNGMFIDAQPSHTNNISYQLYYKINSNFHQNNVLNIKSGILGYNSNNYNFICGQELYRT